MAKWYENIFCTFLIPAHLIANGVGSKNSQPIIFIISNKIFIESKTDYRIVAQNWIDAWAKRIEKCTIYFQPKKEYLGI